MYISISISGIPEARGRLNRLDSSFGNFRQAMQDVGNDLMDYFATQGFSSRGQIFGKTWPRLSPRYEVYKQKTFRGKPTLVATGTMQHSFSSRYNNTSVEVGNDDPKFPFHQLGTKRMPQRQMIGVNTEVEKRVRKIIESEVRNKIRTAGLS